MNYYTVTITSTEKVVDVIEQSLAQLNPHFFQTNQEWERAKPNCIKYSPYYFDFWFEEIEKIAKSHPGEKICFHYFASLGCSYHYMDAECLNGETTILLDETELIG